MYGIKIYSDKYIYIYIITITTNTLTKMFPKLNFKILMQNLLRGPDSFTGEFYQHLSKKLY